MTPEETRKQAQAEGLTLLVAEVKSGYYGVNLSWVGQPKPYQASVWRSSKMVHLGSFATAEEAALCVARSPEGQVAAKKAAARAPLPLTSEEALQQAQAAGLTLRKSDESATGFFGVCSALGSKPYQAAVIGREGKKVYLGRFATAEEAALYVARSPEGQYQAARSAAAARAAPPEVPLTREQALQQAEETGTQLRKSGSNSSGYTDVHVWGEKDAPLNAPGPYRACTPIPGGKVYRGFFATPEEAALRAAQPLEGQEAASVAAIVDAQRGAAKDAAAKDAAAKDARAKHAHSGNVTTKKAAASETWVLDALNTDANSFSEPRADQQKMNATATKEFSRRLSPFESAPFLTYRNHAVTLTRRTDILVGLGTLISETEQDKIQLHVKSSSHTNGDSGYKWHDTNNAAYEGGLLILMGYDDTAYHDTVATGVPSFVAVMPAPGPSGPTGMSFRYTKWTKTYQTNWSIKIFDNDHSLADQLHSFMLKLFGNRSKMGKRMKKTSIEEERWKCGSTHRVELHSLVLYNQLLAEPRGDCHEFASPLDGNHDAMYRSVDGVRTSVQFKGGFTPHDNRAGVWAGLTHCGDGDKVHYTVADFDELTVTYVDEEHWQLHCWTFKNVDLDGSRLGPRPCGTS